MSQPALRNRKQHIAKALKAESWVLFVAIIIMIVIDMIWLSRTNTEFVIARSFSLGAILSYISHVVFAWFLFRHTSVKAKRHIVRQFYLGEAVKWVISLIGFLLIFITIKPLSAFALLIGFIVMQISHIVTSMSIR